MSELKYVKCPFCGEDDFDLWGLEMHLARKECEESQIQDLAIKERERTIATRWGKTRIVEHLPVRAK